MTRIQYNPSNPAHSEFLNAILTKHPGAQTVTRQECWYIRAESGNRLAWPNWLCNDPALKTGKPGVYRLPTAEEILAAGEGMPVEVAASASTLDVPLTATTTAVHQKAGQLKNDHPVVETDPTLIPAVDPLYVGFGIHGDLKRIITSKEWFPLYIYGPTGCGKTMAVEQVCAQTGRGFIRVNITPETDEDDLLGGFRLQDGATVFEDGPVVKAMEQGCVLLLDEVDLASSKIMCLQPVLEGKPVYLKKTKRWVKPAYGFNVIATGNTNGKGDESGNYIGTSVMNEAFLERFLMAYAQTYPKPAIESKILESILSSRGLNEPYWARHLVAWADETRRSAEATGTFDVITTRRLVGGVIAYAIFRNKEKALEAILTRFSGDVRTALMTLYKATTPKTNAPDPSAAPAPVAAAATVPSVTDVPY